MDPILYDVLLESLRVLFLAVIPAVAATALAGFAASVLQASMSIEEPAIGYAARLAAFSAAVYFVWPSVSRAVVNLGEMVFR